MQVGTGELVMSDSRAVCHNPAQTVISCKFVGTPTFVRCPACDDKALRAYEDS